MKMKKIELTGREISEIVKKTADMADTDCDGCEDFECDLEIRGGEYSLQWCGSYGCTHRTDITSTDRGDTADVVTDFGGFDIFGILAFDEDGNESEIENLRELKDAVSDISFSVETRLY